MLSHDLLLPERELSPADRKAHMSMNIERAGQHMRCEAFVPGGMMGKGGEELHGDGKADVGSPEQSAAPDVVGNVGGSRGTVTFQKRLWCARIFLMMVTVLSQLSKSLQEN